MSGRLVCGGLALKLETHLLLVRRNGWICFIRGRNVQCRSTTSRNFPVDHRNVFVDSTLLKCSFQTFSARQSFLTPPLAHRCYSLHP
ncbi:hypothetical protein HF521_016917 [Silurus meridionalis]|uniref:Uncharacterized protein n=1 Tax=Silurus meridionalis TaxID=175797 RepID=A0A8T0BR87_SILME|nr:hypothetical protein HF521_016917 [Silurus meridionalis]